MADGGNQRPPNGGSGRELVNALLDLTQTLFSPPPPSDDRRRSDRERREDRYREEREAQRRDEADARESSDGREPRNHSRDESSTDERRSDDVPDDDDRSTRAQRRRDKDRNGDRNKRRSNNGPEIPRSLRNIFQLFEENDDVTGFEEPIRSLDDLIVSTSVREQIENAIAGVEQHDLLYNQWGIKGIDPHGGCVAISMYGPSGTGKTLCAEAIAYALDRPLMRVNYAQLESKFVGETPKNIQAVFQKAYDADAVLFFDEADSILGARLTNVQHGVDHEFNVSRSVMLQELERFDGVCLFATNLASNYDKAFRRRMEHIEFKLPGPLSRNKLWKHMLYDKVKNKLPLDPEVDVDFLTERSEGLSGGDIQQVILRSARRAAKRPKDERFVTADDLEQEMVRAFRVKEQVGNQG